MKALERALDFVWPRRCELCSRPVDRPGRSLCADCLMRLKFMPTDGCCRLCGRAVEGLHGEFLCEDCRSRSRPAFDRAASAVAYEGDARDLVHAFKFRSGLQLRGDLVDLLEAAVRARFPAEAVDAVVPVPLARSRRFARGYDQCAYLAGDLARRLARPCLKGALGRLGNPTAQSKLDEEMRRENVRGTFAVRRPELVRGRTVLVVDDVMTTGATLSEVAKVLKDAKTAQVWCVTVARSVRT